MTTNRKPWAKILCEPSSPCPKACSRAIGELWKVLEDWHEVPCGDRVHICHLPCYPLVEVSEQGGDHKLLLCLSPTLGVSRSRDYTASHLKGYRWRYQCSSPVNLSVMARAGLTRPPYAHDSKWITLTSPALEWKAVMTSLGAWDGGRGGRSHGVSCCPVTPCKARREQVRLVLSEGLRSCFKIWAAAQ